MRILVAIVPLVCLLAGCEQQSLERLDERGRAPRARTAERQPVFRDEVRENGLTYRVYEGEQTGKVLVYIPEREEYQAVGLTEGWVSESEFDRTYGRAMARFRLRSQQYMRCVEQQTTDVMLHGYPARVCTMPIFGD